MVFCGIAVLIEQSRQVLNHGTCLLIKGCEKPHEDIGPNYNVPMLLRLHIDPIFESTS
jgi:hypothetical protein